MGMFDGKKGLILGVANDHSIAWAIAQVIMERGGPVRLHSSARQAGRRAAAEPPRVAKLTDPAPSRRSSWCRWTCRRTRTSPPSWRKAKEEFGQIDFLLHSIAFATLDDLKRDTIDTSRDGFKLAMEISAYSLLAVVQRGEGHAQRRDSRAC